MGITEAWAYMKSNLIFSVITFSYLPLWRVAYPPSVCSSVEDFDGIEFFICCIRLSTLCRDFAISMVSIFDKMLHIAFTDCDSDWNWTFSISSWSKTIKVTNSKKSKASHVKDTYSQEESFEEQQAETRKIFYISSIYINTQCLFSSLIIMWFESSFQKKLYKTELT